MNALHVQFQVKAFTLTGWVARLLGLRRLAIGCHEKLVQLSPGNSSSHAMLAYLYAQAGRSSQACLMLFRAIELEPASAIHRFNLAYLLQEQQSHEAALQQFEHAIVLQPALDQAWYGKGLSLIKLGRLHEAVDALQRNTELQPLSPYGWYQLAHVYYRLENTTALGAVISKVAEFEPTLARRLKRETGRSES